MLQFLFLRTFFSLLFKKTLFGTFEAYRQQYHFQHIARSVFPVFWLNTTISLTNTITVFLTNGKHYKYIPFLPIRRIISNFATLYIKTSIYCMKISELFKTKKTLSFEIFPPKREDETLALVTDTISKMDALSPDFISVTYGALGNTLSNTVGIAKHIKDNTKAQPLAHLTCVSSTKHDIDMVLDNLQQNGIENILTLRGDIPQNITTPLFSDFTHASDLSQYIHTSRPGCFMTAGACYPEMHPQAESMRQDIENLKKKQDAGMEFFTTQLFFDNQVFYQFLLAARKAGITIPIIPGIMPVTNYNQLDRMIQVTHCAVPLQLRNYFDLYKNDKAALQEIGIIFTSYQILDLMAHDVDGIHLYSMNKSTFITQLMNNIGYVASRFFAPVQK